jgi:hypothetical protein
LPLQLLGSKHQRYRSMVESLDREFLQLERKTAPSRQVTNLGMSVQ